MRGSGRSPAEWVTLVISILVVGALVAVALVEEARRDGDFSEGITITFDASRSTFNNGSYFVPYAIRNTGGTGIVSAEIWIEIYAGEQIVETAEIRVAFLPLEGTQDGVYVTALDPATHTIRGRLESLQIP